MEQLYIVTGLFLTLYQKLLVWNSVDNSNKYFFMPRSFSFLVRDGSSIFLLLTLVSLQRFSLSSFCLSHVNMDQSTDLHSTAEPSKSWGWQGPLEIVQSKLLLEAGPLTELCRLLSNLVISSKGDPIGQPVLMCWCFFFPHVAQIFLIIWVFFQNNLHPLLVFCPCASL